MALLVRIEDVKYVEVFIGRKIRGPIEMRMEANTIYRILHSLNAPKEIYALRNGKRVLLTENNYYLSEDELFLTGNSTPPPRPKKPFSAPIEEDTYKKVTIETVSEDIGGDDDVLAEEAITETIEPTVEEPVVETVETTVEEPVVEEVVEDVTTEPEQVSEPVIAETAAPKTNSGRKNRKK